MLVLTSNAVSANGTIPVRYTCDGEGISPPFSWSNVPEGPLSFALIPDDTDAPTGTYTLWVLTIYPETSENLLQLSLQTMNERAGNSRG